MKTFLIFAVLVFSLVISGCATEFSAKGGPAVLLNLANDLRVQGLPKVSPGGFVERNKDPRLGALMNETQAVSKNVEIFVWGEGDIWVPYNGPAEVYTPGWVRVFEDGKWKRVKLSSRWLEVDELKAINFESALMQSVTLRLADGREIMFNTEGRKETGNNYERINVLFIKLPERLYGYRFNVYSYTSILKIAEGIPYSLPLSFGGNPTRYKFGNQWIGWKLIL